MNTKLLNRVALAILREPKKFNMREWTRLDTESPCGTTACIAGWAIAINCGYENLKALHEARMSYSWGLTSQKGMAELDLTYGQRDPLFHASNWPEEFRLAYNEQGANSEDRADIAFWRIQHFIATEGKE